MQALIDEDLIEQPMGSKILSSATVACKVIKAPIPRTILWRRGNQQLLSSEAVSSEKHSKKTKKYEEMSNKCINNSESYR